MSERMERAFGGRDSHDSRRLDVSLEEELCQAVGGWPTGLSRGARAPSASRVRPVLDLDGRNVPVPPVVRGRSDWEPVGPDLGAHDGSFGVMP